MLWFVLVEKQLIPLYSRNPLGYNRLRTGKIITQ